MTKGKDPNRHYVLAYKADEDTGYPYYLALGYRVETWRDDGPRFAGGVTGKIGEPMEVRGQVLMSIGNEERLDLEQNGHDGSRGVAHFEELMSRISAKRRSTHESEAYEAISPEMREKLSIINETTPMEEEQNG